MNLEFNLPSAILELPDNRYFTIGEVSSLCDLTPSILRYWETEFPSLKPATRKGNRRYYRKADIAFILKIKHLLYTQGFTIEGARKAISTKSTKTVNSEPKKSESSVSQSEINNIINELIELEDILSN